MLPDDAPFVAHKLHELDVSVEELARLVRAPVEDVQAWADGTADPPGPAYVLIAFMGAPGSDAALIVFRNRRGGACLASGVAYKPRVPA